MHRSQEFNLIYFADCVYPRNRRCKQDVEGFHHPGKSSRDPVHTLSSHLGAITVLIFITVYGVREFLGSIGRHSYVLLPHLGLFTQRNILVTDLCCTYSSLFIFY